MSDRNRKAIEFLEELRELLNSHKATFFTTSDDWYGWNELEIDGLFVTAISDVSIVDIDSTLERLTKTGD